MTAPESPRPSDVEAALTARESEALLHWLWENHSGTTTHESLCEEVERILADRLTAALRTDQGGAHRDLVSRLEAARLTEAEMHLIVHRQRCSFFPGTCDCGAANAVRRILADRVRADQGDALGEVGALAPELYERLMEVTADHWRQWRFLKPEVRDKYRAEATQMLAAAGYTEVRAKAEGTTETPDAPRCQHRFPDGTHCTLTDHSAPGLAEVHGPRAAPDAGGGVLPEAMMGPFDD